MSTMQPQLEEIVYDELIWAESPRWRDEALWVSDTQGERLVEVHPAGAEIHTPGTPVNGTSFLPNGDLVAAGMTSQRVHRLAGGTWQLHADLAPLNAGRLGDLTTLADGTVYVGALDDETPTPPVADSGRIIKIDPAGTPSVVADNLVWPNGMAAIDDQRTLIVAETFAGRMTSLTIETDGSLSHPELWIDLRAELGEEFMPDGLWPTRGDSVWAATTGGRAVVLVRAGEVRHKLDVDGFAIAVCLDEGEQNLFVTIANSIDPDEAVFEAVKRKQVRARVERYNLAG